MLNKLVQIGNVIAGVFTLAYPLLVWLVINTEQSFYFSLIIIALGLVKLFSVNKKNRLLPVQQQYFLGVVMVAMGVITLLFKNSQVLQIYPIVISAVLLLVFAGSLATEKSLIEVFAGYVEKNISSEKKHYMRQLTKIWCGFFIGNIILSAISWSMGVDAWMLYNGVISYILMGLLFALEYGYRQLRFGKSKNSR